MAKQVMDSRASKGIAAGVSNEQLRNWTDAGWADAQKEHNYDRSREQLNFEITKGGQITPVNKSYSLEERMKDNLRERGISDPNEGLSDPKYRTIEHFIFGGSTERMREMAFGNQYVDFENYGRNGHIQRMPDIENWAKDIYNFICAKFGEKNVLGFIVHLDETNPHIHCTLMPINDQERFSYKEIFGGKTKLDFKDKYTQLHNDLALVNSKWGLDRGVSVSTTKAKHRSTEEYRKWLSAECSSLEEQKDNYQKAISALKSEITIAERKHKSFSTMISNLNQEKDVLLSQIEELKESLVAGQYSQSEIDGKLDLLRNKLTEIETKIEDKSNKLAETERELEILKIDYEEAFQKMRNLSLTANELSQKVYDSQLNYGQNMAYHLHTEALEQVMKEFIPFYRRLPDSYKEQLDNTLISDLAQTGNKIIRLGLILMCESIDNATDFAESHGGGGGGDNNDNWKRDDDDDDRKWARKCLGKSRQMMKPSVGKKKR